MRFFLISFLLLSGLLLGSCGTTHRFAFSSHSGSFRPPVAAPDSAVALSGVLPTTALAQPAAQLSPKGATPDAGKIAGAAPKIFTRVLQVPKGAAEGPVLKPSQFPYLAYSGSAALPMKPLEPRVVHPLAVAGVVLAGLSFLPFVSGLSLLLAGPLALAGGICSYIALRQINDKSMRYYGSGYAKAGLAVSIVVLTLLALAAAAALAAG